MTSDESLSFIEEHVSEASFLWLQRSFAIEGPHYSLGLLSDLDERISAHIDGLRVAGEGAWNLLRTNLDGQGPEDLFPATVLSIQTDDGRLEELVKCAKCAPETVAGLISGLGWVSAQNLAGRVNSLLDDPSPLKRKLGIAACALHRQDCGAKLDELITDPADSVRIRALRTTGELGRVDLKPRLLVALGDLKPELRFWSAWSAVMLGERARGLDALAVCAAKPGPRQARALQLALQAMEAKTGHELLLGLADSPDAERLRVIGTGYVGDPRYVTWLIEQMTRPAVARIAAEAFVSITGADFNLDQLESLPPEGFEDGPTEDPDDENVELPEDIALPWPNVERIKQWWAANENRFTKGERYFLGQPVSREHCIHVLKEGFQRQRIAAALHMALLQPGAPLFEWRAPAWRQLEELKRLEAQQ